MTCPAVNDPVSPGPVSSDAPGAQHAVRVDVWLWAVRIFKSRSLATQACRAGHVRIGRVAVKAAASVRVGDEVRVKIHGFDRVLRVKAVLRKRVGAPVAATAYEDLTPPHVNLLNDAPVFARERGSGRPTKRDRRQLDALRGRRI